MLKMFGGISVMSVSMRVPRAEENVFQSDSGPVDVVGAADHPVVRPDPMIRDLAAVHGILLAHHPVVGERVSEVRRIKGVELEIHAWLHCLAMS